VTTEEEPAVLVTGSTSGIGLATATRLVRAGSPVIVCGRDEARVERARQHLAGLGAPVHGVVAELHGRGGAAVLADRVEALGVPLGALVLSHGGDQVPEIFADSDPDGFAQLAEIVFLTNARVVHAMLPALRTAPDGGRVVVVASDAGRHPTVGEVMIGALAAATVMFVRTLAREVARDRIRVNAVTVSLTTDTLTHDRVMAAGDFSRRLFEKAAARMPFGPVSAQDVAGTVAHLLSPASSAMTGQVIGVTGGLTT
jgi:3-oxoacyl-[acyl-carrier protein] reductase